MARDAVAPAAPPMVKLEAIGFLFNRLRDNEGPIRDLEHAVFDLRQNIAAALATFSAEVDAVLASFSRLAAAMEDDVVDISRALDPVAYDEEGFLLEEISEAGLERLRILESECDA